MDIPLKIECIVEKKGVTMVAKLTVIDLAAKVNPVGGGVD